MLVEAACVWSAESEVPPRGQTGDPAAERQRRRAPVLGILVVTRNACQPGHVHPAREIRHEVAGRSGELIARAQEQELAEAIRVIHSRVERRRLGRVHEPEDVGRVGGDAVPAHRGRRLLPRREGLRDARLHAVLAVSREERPLVIESAADGVGSRVEGQECRSLWTDTVRWDHVARKGLPGPRIDELHQVAAWIPRPGEVASPFERRGHEGGLGSGAVRARTLPSHVNVRAVAKPGYLDGSAELPVELHVEVVGLRRVGVGEGIRARIPGRRVREQGEAAVEERPLPRAVVAEGPGLGKGRRGAVVHAAIDEKPVAGAKGRVVAALRGPRCRGRRGRGRDFRALETARLVAGRRRSALTRTTCGRRPRCCRTGATCCGRSRRGGPRRGHSLRRDLVEGEQAERPRRRRFARRHRDVAHGRCEPRHLDVHGPHAFRQVQQRVDAVGVRRGDDTGLALGRRHRGTRDGSAGKRDAAGQVRGAGSRRDRGHECRQYSPGPDHMPAR